MIYKIHCYGSMKQHNFFSDLKSAKAELEKRICDKQDATNLCWEEHKNKYRLYVDYPKDKMKHFWVDTIIVLQ